MTTNTARAAAGDARSISQSIAEHVVAFDYSQLPASAVQAAKTLILDTLAVGWAGTTAPGAPEAHALLTEEGGRGDSSVWGYGGKLPVASAAFLNSISGGALDYDGVNTVHAEIVALPAALAMAERERSSGKDFLTAYVIGSDLSSRFGSSITGTHKGWFTTSIYGPFAAAATAAKLLKLDATATRHALGIALSPGGRHAAIEHRAGADQAAAGRTVGALGRVLGTARAARHHRAARSDRRQVRALRALSGRQSAQDSRRARQPLRAREHRDQEISMLRVQPRVARSSTGLDPRARSEARRRDGVSKSRIRRSCTAWSARRSIPATIRRYPRSSACSMRSRARSCAGA